MAVEMSPFFSGANHAYIGQKGGFSLTTMKQPSTLPNPILATENHFIYVYDIYIHTYTYGYRFTDDSLIPNFSDIPSATEQTVISPW